MSTVAAFFYIIYSLNYSFYNLIIVEFCISGKAENTDNMVSVSIELNVGNHEVFILHLYFIYIILIFVSAHGPVDRKTRGATQCWIDPRIGYRVWRRSSMRASDVVGLGFWWLTIV